MPLPLHVGPGKLEGVGVLLDADEVPEGRGEETPEEADSAVEVELLRVLRRFCKALSRSSRPE